MGGKPLFGSGMSTSYLGRDTHNLQFPILHNCFRSISLHSFCLFISFFFFFVFFVVSIHQSARVDRLSELFFIFYFFFNKTEPLLFVHVKIVSQQIHKLNNTFVILLSYGSTVTSSFVLYVYQYLYNIQT